MTKLSAALLAATIMAAGGVPAFSHAQSVAGNPGTGESPRASLEMPDLSSRSIVDLTPATIDEESRDLAMPSEADLQKAFTTRSRSRDGSERSAPPSMELQKLIEDFVKGTAAGTTEKPASAEDPAFDEESRQVFGDDDRIQITRTQAYPFNVIGQIWSRTKDDKWGICSGTLIGKRAVITAAHCLYGHDKGGWMADYEFYPGLNGQGNAPYGKYGFDDAYILEGYITNYKGYYGSVVPWDLGVLILDKPAGKSVGWMGYSVYDPVYPFTANIVGYPGDKPTSTMWRASCNVDPGTATENNFSYLCDTFPGSSGSSVYDYDADTKDRYIMGVNVAETKSENIAVRLNVPYFNWVRGLAEK